MGFIFIQLENLHLTARSRIVQSDLERLNNHGDAFSSNAPVGTKKSFNSDFSISWRRICSEFLIFVKWEKGRKVYFASVASLTENLALFQRFIVNLVTFSGKIIFFAAILASSYLPNKVFLAQY